MTMSSNARDMAFAAREKVQGLVSSLRSMTADEEGSIFKLKKAISTSDNNMQSTLDNLMKTMFGSCAVGVPEQPTVSLASRTRSSETSEPVSPSREKEEFFYSQFLAPARVAQAVTSVREQAEARPVDHQRVESKAASLSRPFPMSSPTRRDPPTPSPVVVHEIIASPLAIPAATNTTDRTLSFDDGISCLSAHTLEEMARNDDLIRGQKLRTVPSDLTSEGFETVDYKHEPIKLDSQPSRVASSKSRNNAACAAIELSHNNSRITQVTKRSAGTRSTQTSSFENAWRQDEQKYWENVVELENTDMGTAEQRREIMAQRVQALKDRTRTPTNAGRSPLFRESVSNFHYTR